MNRVIAKSSLLGLAFTMLTACVGSAETSVDTSTDEVENLGQAEEAITTCRSPITANASYIESSPGCTWASVKITNVSNNQVMLNWYAGIDQVSKVWVPLFCWNGHCSGGYWNVTGISGSWYGPISVSTEGVVNVTYAGLPATINPTSCSVGANGTTTITGLGTDNVPYAIVLTNTYFC